MISHRVPIDDMAKLYQAFDKRDAGVRKVRMSSSLFCCMGTDGRYLQVFVETQFSSPPAPGCPTLTRVEEWTK